MDVTEATKMMSALSHATRYRCYALLAARGEYGAADLASALGIPKNLLSSHVTILMHAGLITSVRTGRSVVYSADRAAFARLSDHLRTLAEMPEPSRTTG